MGCIPVTSDSCPSPRSPPRATFRLCIFVITNVFQEHVHITRCFTIPEKSHPNAGHCRSAIRDTGSKTACGRRLHTTVTACSAQLRPVAPHNADHRAYCLGCLAVGDWITCMDQQHGADQNARQSKHRLDLLPTLQHAEGSSLPQRQWPNGFYSPAAAIATPANIPNTALAVSLGAKPDLSSKIDLNASPSSSLIFVSLPATQ